MTTLADLKDLLFAHWRLNRPKNLRRGRAALAHVEAFLGATRTMDNVTYLDLTHYVEARLAERAAPGTVRQELACLRRGWRELERAGLSRPPIFPTVTVRNARQGFFEEEQIEEVMRHLPTYLRPLVGFLALTGWRRSEATGLTWARVDFRAQTVRLEASETKNDRPRLFPFSTFPELRDLLLEQRTAVTKLERQLERMITWVFPRGPGHSRPDYYGQRITEFRKSWSTACRLAGCPGMLVHDLRRSAVRRLTRAGVPRSIAMRLTGHLTESIYLRYDITSEADLVDAVGRVATYRAMKMQ
ncbi:MAG: tyrosine-type recombinase/integrase [Planctomycetes bacterium]|nr:tyrosine-type recombinase/integrase [Planctomycetota bacterium]